MWLDVAVDKRLLIFDLDETLVHCFEPQSENYFEIMTGEGEIVKAEVTVRPHAL